MSCYWQTGLPLPYSGGARALHRVPHCLILPYFATQKGGALTQMVRTLPCRACCRGAQVVLEFCIGCYLGQQKER